MEMTSRMETSGLMDDLMDDLMDEKTDGRIDWRTNWLVDEVAGGRMTDGWDDWWMN